MHAQAGKHSHQHVEGEAVDFSAHQIADPGLGNAHFFGRLFLGHPLLFYTALNIHHETAFDFHAFSFGGIGFQGIPYAFECLCHQRQP